jgi:DNA helicase-2/ATP-dependent DNA helicase PcrA
VQEVDPQYIELPRAQKQFPPVGELPRAFSGIKGVRWSPETERSFKRKESNSQSPRRLQSKASPTPQGPTAMRTPAEINAIQVGMQVQHAKFGIGKVISIEGSGKDRKAVVFFDNIGQKTLLLAFAKLAIIS